jgi:hypothetical protein
MLPQTGDGVGKSTLLLTESVAQALESFALIAEFRRGCDRTLRPFWVGGPFPARLTTSFNPARPSTARLAGKMPSLREGDRYFWGCASQAQQLLLPSSPSLYLFA